ncbi:MAG: Vitamin B12 import ATP-binding protein BtuD [Myxococcota bacterium]|nr:Vitamin B12 import ATP-binding protein BtuD [Myxococcota bacterium]
MLIEVKDLKKTYGAIEALKGVSFNIEAGEIVGLLGHNGAGKTTCMKILTGFIEPTAGEVRVGGQDVVSHRLEVQRRMGYLPESAPLYPEMLVQEYLEMAAGLRGIPEDGRRRAISKAVYRTGLEQVLARPIGKLSKGFRQRVGLAQAILHEPEILILDEPTSGLDPTQIVEIRQLIKDLSKHSTILFSTHILPEVEAVCQRAIIIIGGSIAWDADFTELHRHGAHVLRLLDAPDEAAEAVRRLQGVAAVTPVRENDVLTLRIRTEEGRDAGNDLFELSKKESWKVVELRRDVDNLESVFNRLMKEREAA